MMLRTGVSSSVERLDGVSVSPGFYDDFDRLSLLTLLQDRRLCVSVLSIVAAEPGAVAAFGSGDANGMLRRIPKTIIPPKTS